MVHMMLCLFLSLCLLSCVITRICRKFCGHVHALSLIWAHTHDCTHLFFRQYACHSTYFSDTNLCTWVVQAREALMSLRGYPSSPGETDVVVKMVETAVRRIQEAGHLLLERLLKGKDRAPQREVLLAWVSTIADLNTHRTKLGEAGKVRRASVYDGRAVWGDVMTCRVLPHLWWLSRGSDRRQRKLVTCEGRGSLAALPRYHVCCMHEILVYLPFPLRPRPAMRMLTTFIA